ncbi:MAG: 2-oxoglutarate dehydrogenase complex dihydrolipoyllysine-residue succinyltransferase [Pseudomonadota bacterium]
MSTEINVPTLPESVADATVINWHKQAGDAVTRDEILVDIETDKVVLEVPAPVDGVLANIAEDEGAVVTAGQLLGTIEAGASAGASAPAEAAPAAAAEQGAGDDDAQAGPEARQLLAEHGLNAADVKGTGKNGRILPEDVRNHVSAASASPAAAAPAAAPAAAASEQTVETPPVPTAGAVSVPDEERAQKRVPMTRLRARIAERLLYAKQSTAMLTTFNELDMQPFMDLRNTHKDQFEKSHGVKLGFMSIFVKAATEALKRYPDVNASIDDNDIVYHNFCDVGVAVSSDRGLVVPVLRNAEQMSLAEIEATIGDYAGRAREGKLSIEEMTGGTFTISNGGVFGSLLSTPILNPPQSAILGMHATKPRPVAINGEVVIRPMMYLALTYDHRLIDGREAVLFLRKIKEGVEDPTTLLLEL